MEVVAALTDLGVASDITAFERLQPRMPTCTRKLDMHMYIYIHIHTHA